MLNPDSLSPSLPRHATDLQLKPMRSQQFKRGDQVAWVPQAFEAFLTAHEASLPKAGSSDAGAGVGIDDDADADADADGTPAMQYVPSLRSRLMRRPADGTANAATVERVERTEVPGLTLLHLRRLEGALAPHPRASAESGAESGVDTAVSDDGEGGAEAAACSSSASSTATYVLPVLSRRHANVDQHVLPLSAYKEALERCARSPHVAVPFASGESASTEEIWEGRAFDQSAVFDPERYPCSLYKSLHCVWYRQLKKTGKNKLGDHWLFDDEQTDNFQSPWDTVPSSCHATWRSAYPVLAKYVKPRTRRGVVKPSALVDAPESMELDFQGCRDLEDVDQPDVMQRVLKRLLSNEACLMFFHPVPLSEVDYHTKVKEPISLSEIVAKVEAQSYSGSYHAFHSDVELLLSNAFLYHDDHSA